LRTLPTPTTLILTASLPLTLALYTIDVDTAQLSSYSITGAHADLDLTVRNTTDRPRDAASGIRQRYRNVLHSYANTPEDLRYDASGIFGMMTMVIQLMEWFDTIAGTLKDAARCLRLSKEAWETLTWSAAYFL
jgi:hypothetical protein